jgi:hypothetical protein
MFERGELTPSGKAISACHAEDAGLLSGPDNLAKLGVEDCHKDPRTGGCLDFWLACQQAGYLKCDEPK